MFCLHCHSMSCDLSPWRSLPALRALPFLLLYHLWGDFTSMALPIMISVGHARLESLQAQSLQFLISIFSH